MHRCGTRNINIYILCRCVVSIRTYDVPVGVVLSQYACMMSLQAFEELQVQLPRHGICIAVKEKLKKDSGVASDEAYNKIVGRLLSKSRARGQTIYSVFPRNSQALAAHILALRVHIYCFKKNRIL